MTYPNFIVKSEMIDAIRVKITSQVKVNCHVTVSCFRLAIGIFGFYFWKTPHDKKNTRI